MDCVVLGTHIPHISREKALKKFAFQTQENVWRRSRDFTVNAKNSKRKWAVSEPELEGNADYVPTYELPQLFRWRGYWVEVKRSSTSGRGMMAGQGTQNGGVIFISYATILFLLFGIRLTQEQYLYSQDEGTFRIGRRSATTLQRHQSSECHRSHGRLGKYVLLFYYNMKVSLFRSLRMVPPLCGATSSKKPVGLLVPSSYRKALLNH